MIEMCKEVGFLTTITFIGIGNKKLLEVVSPAEAKVFYIFLMASFMLTSIMVVISNCEKIAKEKKDEENKHEKNY